MRLLIVGDCHGDDSFVATACRVAKKYDIGTVMQVGDFGIWDHHPSGVKFLDQLDDNAARRGVRWIFLPGNHENYDRLEEYSSRSDHVGSQFRTKENFVAIRENVLYTQKVNLWEWEGQTFKAVGGAVSIDKMYRKPGTSWWHQEQLTEAELEYAINLGEADFLFTHDCPTYAPFGGRLKPDLDSVAHRQKIDKVVDATNAKVHFHGHMHSFYDYQNYAGGKIWGLECNDGAMYNPYGPRDVEYKNMAIFDTRTHQVEWPDKQGV